jgi:hypothetical protein
MKDIYNNRSIPFKSTKLLSFDQQLLGGIFHYMKSLKSSRDPLYDVHHHMINRCYNPNDIGYRYYGERGISVCFLWRSNLLAFIKWARSNGWKRGLVIDRINNDGNYEPTNCRFVTPEVNSNNRRNNTFIFFNGDTKTFAEWGRLMGISPGVIRRRLIIGWSIEKAFTTPVKTNKYKQSE